MTELIFGLIIGICIAGMVMSWLHYKQMDDAYDDFADWADEAERVITLLERRLADKGDV